MKAPKARGVLLGVAIVSLSASVYAVCNQSGASQADRDLWNTHGCWQDFYLWQYQAYDMRGGDWGGRGWNDACNSNLEYPKHWNAAYLVTYGLIDNLAQSFHGTDDYRATAERPDNDYHNRLYHTPTDNTTIFGQWVFHLIGPNEVQTSCLLYNARASNANPGSRAGDFMHEGWHGWMERWGWNNGSCNGHTCGTPGSCTAKNACDYFYFHGIGAYAFGAMWENDGTANRFHSPNQVQVEFLCDVSDQPQAWVPASVRTAAAADANSRSASRFINGPGYTCGSPRPW